MGLGERLRRVFGAGDAPSVRVRLMIKGRIGGGWYDVDQELQLPAGSTLEALIALAERRGLGLVRALDASPHLRHTLMWNGERCPVDENQARVIVDGDQIFLLAPLAGG